MQNLISSLEPQLAFADRYGFRVAIENHSNAILNSLDSFKVFLDLAVHPRLWLAIAPYHLQRDHIPVEEVIALAAHRTLYFYAWQNEPGPRQLPGVGSTDFTPWLDALARANYRGDVNPFMHENLKAAAGEDRGATPPDRMSENLAQARRYLLECRKNIRK